MSGRTDPTQPDGYGTATSVNCQQAEALRVQHTAARQLSVSRSGRLLDPTLVLGLSVRIGAARGSEFCGDADQVVANRARRQEQGPGHLAHRAVGARRRQYLRLPAWSAVMAAQ